MKWIAAIWVLMLTGLAAAAPPKATVEAKLNWDALHPGQQAVVAVVVQIPEGVSRAVGDAQRYELRRVCGHAR